jgi:predicted RNase H-like HicB family nuclease
VPEPPERNTGMNGELVRYPMEVTVKYKVYFFFDPEYQGYVADVLDLPGCVTQGKTIEEVEENVKEAIEAYLEVEQAKDLAHRSNFIHPQSFVAEVTVGETC